MDSGETALKYKVTLLGDEGVGKTSLVKRFVHNEFGDKYMKTLGTNIYSKESMFYESGKPMKVVLQIWDMMGQRAFKSVIKSSLENTNGVFFVCDLTHLDTLNNLLHWIKITFNNTKNVAFVFIGNKSDMDNIEFGYPALTALAGCFKSPSFLTSAKSGSNVEAAFQMIAYMIYQKRFVPAKDGFDFNIAEGSISPVIMAEDFIINTFCKAIGGLEAGMPMVQGIYKQWNVDLSQPTKRELEVVIKHMTHHLKKSDNPKQEEIAQKFSMILASLPDERT